jgi:uncharacterized glyoxalase superfamily protein PhnB
MKFWKIVPHLPVKDLQETIAFYKDRLGFTEEWFYGDPPTDGGCRRDELRMLFGKASGPLTGIGDLSLVLFVTDVESVYEEMKQRGIKILQPLALYDYGIKEFAIQDCNGYMLRFAESI